MRVAIVGAGFGGIGMAIALRREGIEDFVVLDEGSDVGGTWRDNTYPGCQCDVPSHLYSFAADPNPDWTELYARQGEILQYMRSCVERHGLTNRIRLQTRVTGAVWDEQSRQWSVTTDRGDRVVADVLVTATGGLSRPSMPEIDGLDAFAGDRFHSARWRHDVPLAGKRVGVIGTGASAIQIVPAIAGEVRKLTVFQRSAPWILPRATLDYPAAVKGLFERVDLARRLHRSSIHALTEFFGAGFVAVPAILRGLERVARHHIRRSVADARLREAVTPDYPFGCKRVLFSSAWYPALQRQNVELVTSGIERVTSDGVRTRDGRHIELDAIVLATGFQAAEATAPFAIHGREGRELERLWAKRAQAYKGSTVAGFPNLFTIIGPNTGLGHSSMILMIEAQVGYVIDAMREMDRRGAVAVEVREDVVERYNREIRERLAGTVWEAGCSSWYRTAEGVNTTLWPGLTGEFARRLRRFDAENYAFDRAISGSRAGVRRPA